MDQMPDLLIGIDVQSAQDSLHYTVVLKVNHDGNLNFYNHTLIDPDCGRSCRFLLLDHVPFEPHQSSKDLLVLSRSSFGLALIKNFDPIWVYLEITPGPIVTDQHYQTLETLYSGSLNFHMYLIDYDLDGHLDIVYPDKIRNQLILLRNGGSMYWNKVNQIKDKYALSSKDRLQRELNSGVDKWHAHSMIDSAYTVKINDFVFVNIDTEDKLAIVLLGQDSIRKLFPNFL